MSLVRFEKAIRVCAYCKRETEALIVGPVYYCPKCGKFWGSAETLYECTRAGCSNIFSRSESEKVDYRANQCPLCGWPYGRTYTRLSCPACSPEVSDDCEEGVINLCEVCGRWSFVKTREKKESKRFSLKKYVEAKDK